MIEPNNRQDRRFHVIVKTPDGERFYSGYDTAEEAAELAQEQNKRAKDEKDSTTPITSFYFVRDTSEAA